MDHLGLSISESRQTTGCNASFPRPNAGREFLYIIPRDRDEKLGRRESCTFAMHMRIEMA